LDLNHFILVDFVKPSVCINLQWNI